MSCPPPPTSQSPAQGYPPPGCPVQNNTQPVYGAIPPPGVVHVQNPAQQSAIPTIPPPTVVHVQNPAQQSAIPTIPPPTVAHVQNPAQQSAIPTIPKLDITSRVIVEASIAWLIAASLVSKITRKENPQLFKAITVVLLVALTSTLVAFFLPEKFAKAARVMKVLNIFVGLSAAVLLACIIWS